ncbi:MAG: hypothetical protein KDA84_22240, partial [Planctomycetaceae bacterium]|nr:hypothetical protein [Planctomycetaceae bacterium]
PTPLTSNNVPNTSTAYNYASNPTPTAHSATPWTKVSQRAAQQPDIQGANYMQVVNNPPPLGPVPGTPTAAAVWQARQ